MSEPKPKTDLLRRVPLIGESLANSIEGAPTVSVVRLSGVIGQLGGRRTGLVLSELAAPIERAFKYPRLKAVALAVNSPGGAPVQAALIADRIRQLAEEKEVPVFAFCEDVAASGGYWLAAAADEIYAHGSSIVGSIGVISAGFGFPQLLEKIGVERRVHVSGEKKAMLDPFVAEKPDEVERLEQIQADVHKQFQAYVRERREEKLQASEDVLFSGEFWTGRRALELGLVDGIGELRSVMRERYGDKVSLKLVGPPRRLGLMRFFGGHGDLPGDAIAAIEERLHWSRFGL